MVTGKYPIAAKHPSLTDEMLHAILTFLIHELQVTARGHLRSKVMMHMVNIFVYMHMWPRWATVKTLQAIFNFVTLKS
jgi:hypothetical protein